MELEQKDLTEKIIGAAIEVHRHLGPGLLESAYEACLAHELTVLGLDIARQQSLPISYKGLQLDMAYRLDLVVENLVLLELKSVERVEPIHEAQLLTYLRLARLPVGLIINFNVHLLRQGIKRFALTESISALSAPPR
jgi:GxxExxY protein